MLAGKGGKEWDDGTYDDGDFAVGSDEGRGCESGEEDSGEHVGGVEILD